MKHPEWLKFMKEQYPPGTRIRLIEMNDPYSPVSPGTEGTVNFIDDQCQLHVDWDNGPTIALIPGNGLILDISISEIQQKGENTPCKQ